MPAYALSESVWNGLMSANQGAVRVSRRISSAELDFRQLKEMSVSEAMIRVATDAIVTMFV